MSELRYWLALLRAPGLGTRGALEVLTRTTPEALFSTSLSGDVRERLRADTREYFRNPDWSAVDVDLTWLATSPRNHVITLHDSRYPTLLKEIADPPLVLFVHGDPAVLNRPQIAMVGSRNPHTARARECACVRPILRTHGLDNYQRAGTGHRRGLS